MLKLKFESIKPLTIEFQCAVLKSWRKRERKAETSQNEKWKIDSYNERVLKRKKKVIDVIEISDEWITKGQITESVCSLLNIWHKSCDENKKRVAPFRLHKILFTSLIAWDVFKTCQYNK